MSQIETAIAEFTTDTNTQEAQSQRFTTTSEVASSSLRDCVKESIENYFKHLDGQQAANVYELVMAEVEAPLLEVVMAYTRHNQTKAAEVLGLNRGTLRKKLKQYGQL
ncbi:DNA-binding transcriptional regulator Fis [Halioxenophilus sp. WMMB6]|uniref:DNA-binding transcriptional regulator Fis n=1 Tax=Halioxenophilus sp. WMMB6 TaxID=3073815 RepID=UPI00295ED53D|nr:DNA-binding transcriptional regulator Fis [Halioxenophilus sp. WMMB6]